MASAREMVCGHQARRGGFFRPLQFLIHTHIVRFVPTGVEKIINYFKEIICTYLRDYENVNWNMRSHVGVVDICNNQSSHLGKYRECPSDQSFTWLKLRTLSEMIDDLLCTEIIGNDRKNSVKMSVPAIITDAKEGLVNELINNPEHAYCIDFYQLRVNNDGLCPHSFACVFSFRISY